MLTEEEEEDIDEDGREEEEDEEEVIIGVEEAIFELELLLPLPWLLVLPPALFRLDLSFV